MEYHKINTMFERDTKFKIMPEVPRMSYIGIINKWQITEKIDGTNIRIILSADGKLTFQGRTNNSSIPSHLLAVLMDMFNSDKLKQMFWKEGELPCNVVLYGEGYGEKIQKCGASYRKGQSFRLFDVLVADKWWLDWTNTCGVAASLGIKTAPLLGDWTFEEIVHHVRLGILSVVAQEENNMNMVAEGIIGRTVEPLFDKHGHRLIIKLKTKDFK